MADTTDFIIPDFGNFNIDLDLSAFDTTAVEFMGEDLEQSRYITPKFQPVNPRHIIYDNAKRLGQKIDIRNHTRHDLIVGGNFIFGDFIEALLTTQRIQAKRMVINTLSLSQENVDSLRNLMHADYILQLDLIVSVYFYSHEKHALVPYIYKALDTGGRFQMTVTIALTALTAYTSRKQIKTLARRFL